MLISYSTVHSHSPRARARAAATVKDMDLEHGLKSEASGPPAASAFKLITSRAAAASYDYEAPSSEARSLSQLVVVAYGLFAFDLVGSFDKFVC